MVDGNGQPLEIANVILFRTKDTSLAQATTTNETGKFLFEITQPDSYWVKVSYVESELTTVEFEVKESIDLGKLVLDISSHLDEIVVVADKPKLERKADRYVFSVANTSLIDGTIVGALSRTPGIMMINNQLTFKGESNIGIMINGKLVNLPSKNVIDLLNNTSAGAIKSIEIITNPPAKYSAEQSLLINVIMDGGLVSGYNGSVNTSFGQGDFPKYGFGTDHFFKSRKTDFTFSYSFSDNKDFLRFVDNTNFIDSSGTSSWNSDQVRVKNTASHNISLFSDIGLGERTTLSITAINQLTPNKDQDIETVTRLTGIFDEGFSSFISKNPVFGNTISSSLYLDVSHKFPNAKKNLSASLHFTHYDEERGQELSNVFFNEQGQIIDEIDFGTNQNQQINIYSAQIDFDSNLGEKGNYYVGSKFAKIDSKSELTQEGTEGLTTNLLASQGVFDYDEQIYAAYASANLNYEKLQMAFGLRAEYTRSKGNLISGDEEFENEYLEWFPSFSTKYDLGNDRNLLLYYYRRITRPRYNQINPFQLFQGYNSTVEGNPGLQPATRHYLAGGYNFNKWLGVEFFYRHRRNQLRILTFQDNANNILRFVNTNVDRELGYGIDVIINKRITSFWQSYALISYYYLDNRFQDLETDVFGSTSGWTFVFTNNNSFSFLPNKDLAVDLDFRYHSPATYGNVEKSSFGSVNMSLNKRLWSGKGSIGFGIQDIFSQSSYKEIRFFLDQDNTSFTHLEIPIANFNFRYRFGNTTINPNKKRKQDREVNRI